MSEIDGESLRDPLPLGPTSSAFADEENNASFVSALRLESQARKYETGDGVMINPERASELYNQAFNVYHNLANGNHAPALYRCGVMTQKGKGTVQDKAKAAYFLALACDQGYGAAEYQMSEIYETTDPVMARRLLTRAAFHGNEQARRALESALNDSDESELNIDLRSIAFMELIPAFCYQTNVEWFRNIFEIALQGIKNLECDRFGQSFLGACCRHNQINPFQRLIERGVKVLNLTELDSAVAFYRYLKSQEEQGGEEAREALEAFKKLEERNRYLKFKMAIEHLLGGPLSDASKVSAISIEGAESGRKILPFDILERRTNRVIRMNTDGRSTVAWANAEGYKGTYRLYFKFFPEFPGVEQAVSRLSHELIGFGASPSELFKVTSSLQVPLKKPGLIYGESVKEVTLANIPVLVSLGIDGPTLKDVFANPVYPRTGLNVLENLDTDSVHMMMLVAMLTNPEDGKGDNYIAESFTAADGTTKYRIIGIDNDHAFVPASEMVNRVRISTRTILYAFDEITKPISESVRKLFMRTDLDTLLRNWLCQLRHVNESYAKIFPPPSPLDVNQVDHNDLVFKNYNSFIGVPFPKRSLQNLYAKFIRLREALKDLHKPVTPLELFIAIEPSLRTRYGNIFRNFPTMNPFERYAIIEGLAASRTLSSTLNVLESYQIPNTFDIRRAILNGKAHSPGQATDELEEIMAIEFSEIQSGKLEPFKQLKLGPQIENALREIDFGRLSYEENVQFLKAIEEKLHYSSIRLLTLRNHLSIKTADIKKWSEKVMKDLTHVDFCGCQGIHEGGLRYLIQKAEALKYLNFSKENDSSLQTNKSGPVREDRLLSLNLTSRSLVYLDLSGDQLTQLKMEAPSLKTLKVQGNKRLTFIDGSFPELRYLDMRGTRALDNSNMGNFILYNHQFLNEGQLIIEEDHPSAQLMKDMQRFVRGKLIYRPTPGSDENMKVLPIADIKPNPFEGAFDLSGCGDTSEDFSIRTGYKKRMLADNKGKVEIWFVPRFVVENDITRAGLFSSSPARHLQPIMDEWPPAADPIGIIWTWWSYDITYYDYLTSRAPENISDNNLYDICRHHQFRTTIPLLTTSNGPCLTLPHTIHRVHMLQKVSCYF